MRTRMRMRMRMKMMRIRKTRGKILLPSQDKSIIPKSNFFLKKKELEFK